MAGRGKMRRRIVLIALAILGGSALPAPGQQLDIQRPDGRRVATAQIDESVGRLMQAAHVTGAGVAIFHGGKIVYLKAYGSRDTEKRLPLTTDSVMTSASLSKAAFASLVMLLVQEHIIDLDKPIAQYLPKPLPDYPRYEDLKGDERYKKITIRMLLSHTSGFPNWRFFEDDKRLRIHFEPGSRYAYSGEGIDLAQFVVETVTQRSVTDLMEEKLFVPAGMSRTSMVWQAKFEEDFANGYDEYGRPLGPQRRKKPDAAGSMQTTLHDYATLLSGIMQRKVMNGEAVGRMLSPQIGIHSARQFPSLENAPSAANDGIGLSYGLGWGLYTSPYGKAFFKEGHDDGWRHLALCFANGGGILIMTNSSNGEGIFKPLIDSILGPTLFPFDWEDYTPYDLLPPLPKLKEHKSVALSGEELDRLVGRYALSPEVILTVTVESGRLFIQGVDGMRREYRPESALDFYSLSAEDEGTFKVAADGRVEALVLHQDGKDVELKRVPDNRVD